MKFSLFTLAALLSTCISYAQTTPTFGHFGLFTYAGTQHCKIEELDIDVTMPYSIDYSIEGHYMTDDIYYIGRALNAVWGEETITENGEYISNTNGAYVDFSLGGFNEVTENFGYGIGMRANFGFTGISKYNGKIDNFHFNLGIEAPFVYAFNRYARIYAKTGIANVWTNHEVFGGWAWDANADFVFSPFSFLLLGAGVGTDYSSRSVKQNTGELMNMKTTSLYYRLTIGISFGTCQGY